MKGYFFLLCDITFVLFMQYNTAKYVRLNARSDVTIGNEAYVDIAFFTQNGSYNNIVKFYVLCGISCIMIVPKLA
jgi:hypothetical protein